MEREPPSVSRFAVSPSSMFCAPRVGRWRADEAKAEARSGLDLERTSPRWQRFPTFCLARSVPFRSLRIFGPAAALALLAAAPADAQDAALPRLSPPVESLRGVPPDALGSALSDAVCSERQRVREEACYQPMELIEDLAAARATGVQASLLGEDDYVVGIVQLFGWYPANLEAGTLQALLVPEYVEEGPEGRWTWDDGYGTTTVYAVAAPGRAALVQVFGEGRTAEAELAVVDLGALAALPAQPSFLDPIDRSIRWSLAEAVQHAEAQRPSTLYQVAPERLAALLPELEIEGLQRNVRSGYARYGGWQPWSDGGPEVTAAYATLRFDPPNERGYRSWAEVTLIGLEPDAEREAAVQAGLAEGERLERVTVRGREALRSDPSWMPPPPPAPPPPPPTRPPPPAPPPPPPPSVPPPPAPPGPPAPPSEPSIGIEEIELDMTMPVSPPPPGSPRDVPPPPVLGPPPRPAADPYPQTAFLLSEVVRAEVRGIDSVAVAQLLDALDLDAVAAVQPREVLKAADRYGRQQAFAGAALLERDPRAARVLPEARRSMAVVTSHGVGVMLGPEAGRFVASPVSVRCPFPPERAAYDAASPQGVLAVVSARPLDPCVAVGAPRYPASDAAEAAGAGAFAVVEDLGLAAATPERWLRSWDARRHALLPTWALPMEPAAEARERRVGPHRAVAYPLSQGRVPVPALAAEALFFPVGDRLVSVVGVAVSAEEARAVAESVAAALGPYQP